MTIGRVMAAAFFLVGSSVAPAFAQAKPVKPAPNAGIEVGLNMSRVSPDASGQSGSRGPGLLVGGWVGLQPWKAVGIQIEALYTQKRSHLSSQTDLKLDYIEVPILAKLKLIKAIYMLEGIALSFPVNAKVDSTTAGASKDIKDSVTNPDLSMVIGGGVPVTPKVAVEFRYTGGFKVVETSTGAPLQHLRALSGIVRIKL